MNADPRANVWRAGPGVVAALILIGIATGLGVTRAVGCVYEPLGPGDGLFAFVAALWIDPPLNVLLSAAMLVLACTSVVTSRQVALVLMSVEFIGFVLFLLLLKGGYAVGFIGTPMPQVVEYDALSVTVRIGVLGLLAFGQHPDRRFFFKVGLTGAGAALVIVGLKVALFRIPAW